MRCRDIISQEPPDKLRVIVDNAAAVENVGRFLSRNGYQAASLKTGENEWIVEAAKDGGKAALQEDRVEGAPPEHPGRKTLVLITTETLGRGDEELGAKLMANFLGSLPEFGAELWRIILLNGAVKLAAREGPALDNLQKLASQGVSILVCGTCLTHYGLLEQKKVGETTNMMDVVTSLSLADKIARP